MGRRIIPSRVDTNSTLTDNGQLCQLLLGDGRLAVGNHDCQRAGTNKSSAGAQAPTDGHSPVHNKLHIHGDKVGTPLPPQELEGAPQAALEVIRPLKFGGINVDVALGGDIELPGGELGILDVADLDAEGVLGGGGLGGHGEQGVGGDGHGKDGIEGVVDVLADDVDSAGRAGHKGGLAAVSGGETL